MSLKFLPPQGEEQMHIALISGHTALVTREGTDLPVMFRKEALSRGCEVQGVDLADPDKPNADETQKSKQELIIDAIDDIMARNLADEMTGDGKPKTDVLSKQAGFTVSAGDRDAALEVMLADND